MASDSDVESGPTTQTYGPHSEMDSTFTFRIKSAVSGRGSNAKEILSNVEGYVKAGDVSAHLPLFYLRRGVFLVYSQCIHRWLRSWGHLAQGRPLCWTSLPCVQLSRLTLNFS